MLRTIRASIIVLRYHQANVIYASSDFFPDVIPSYIAKSVNGRVAWIQKVFHLIPPSRRISCALQRDSHVLIRYKADITITDNSLLMRELYLRDFRKDSIELNYPGVDIDLYMDHACESFSGFDALFLGRLHPSKGIFSVIDIWERVCAIRKGARLAIVGNGDSLVVEKLASLLSLSSSATISLSSVSSQQRMSSVSCTAFEFSWHLPLKRVLKWLSWKPWRQVHLQ